MSLGVAVVLVLFLQLFLGDCFHRGLPRMQALVASPCPPLTCPLSHRLESLMYVCAHTYIYVRVTNIIEEKEAITLRAVGRGKGPRSVLRGAKGGK